jgi:hypothetical protein
VDRRRAGGHRRLEAVEAAATVFPGCGFSGQGMPNVDAKAGKARGLWRPIQGMDATGLPGLQSSSSRMPPCGALLLASFADGAILVEEHEIVGVYHDIGGLKAAAATAWKRGADGGFQTGEGARGPER